MKKVGLWLAIAALLVNGARFVLIFLRVDSLVIPITGEAVMLAMTGIATGLVLTGGGAYIAHSLAESQKQGMVRTVMLICWFLLLIFNVILLAPLMVSAIRESSMKSVFDTNFSQWLWSITSVLAVEIISAGAMAAYALEGKPENAVHSQSQPSAFSILTGALVRRLENSIAPPASAVVTDSAITFPQPVTPPSHENRQTEPLLQVREWREGEVHPTAANAINDQAAFGEAEGKTSKAERQRLLLNLLKSVKQQADIPIDDLALKLHVSPQTIYRDLADLRAKQLLKFS